MKIEGHTDNAPIRTAHFPSNWELSASRAAEVARMLVTAGFPGEKLSIEGFAQYRLKIPNDSPQSRVVNRRIETVYQRGSIRKNMIDVLRR
ncbi:MAG: OmpA family protein [Nitrospinaceae bacterium]|nr:OmpA family protein [Nitrospinaceae bacterium]